MSQSLLSFNLIKIIYFALKTNPRPPRLQPFIARNRRRIDCIQNEVRVKFLLQQRMGSSHENFDINTPIFICTSVLHPGNGQCRRENDRFSSRTDRSPRLYGVSYHLQFRWFLGSRPYTNRQPHDCQTDRSSPNGRYSHADSRVYAQLSVATQKRFAPNCHISLQPSIIPN